MKDIVLNSDENIIKKARPQKIFVLFWGINYLARYTGILAFIILFDIFKILLTLNAPSDKFLVIFLAFIFVILVIIPFLLSKLKFNKTEYVITTKRVILKTGILGYKVKSVPYHKISDVSYVQTFIDRLFNVASIRIQTLAGQISANPGGAEFNLQYLTEHEASEILNILSKVSDS